jgi:translation initiation factor 1A
MPKNKGKGGKSRRRGKGGEGDKRELVFKEDGQEYGQVLKMLGNGRCDCMCIDGVKRMCHIRGKMRKRVWIATGDIVLISLRDFQDEKADIILKYSADEARNLKGYGELPDTIKINETDLMEGEFSDDGVEFADFVDSESDKDAAGAKPKAAAAKPKKEASSSSAAVTVPTLASGGIDLDAI